MSWNRCICSNEFVTPATNSCDACQYVLSTHVAPWQISG